MKKIGLVKLGIQSREPKFVIVRGHGGFGKIGVMKIGLKRQPHINFCYVVRAKLETKYSGVYSCTGVIQVMKQCFYRVLAKLIVPNYRAGFSVTGKLARGASSSYSVKGVIEQTNRTNYPVTGLFGQGASSLYGIIGFCRANYSQIYGVIGAIKQKAIFRYTVKGICGALAFGRYSVKGLTRLPYTSIYSAVGTLAYGAKFAHHVTGIIKQSYNSGYVVVGHLANTIGKWHYAVRAKLSVPFFIASVPNRMQKFITNKRWYKDTENGREYRDGDND